MFVYSYKFWVLIGWLRTYYLVGSLGFGCELWTDQSGLVSPIRLTSAFLLAASIAARSSLNDWIMSKNPFSFRTSSRHVLLSHINCPKETNFKKIVSNHKFLAQITKLEFSTISSNILIFANTCAANTVRPFETISKKFALKNIREEIFSLF